MLIPQNVYPENKRGARKPADRRMLRGGIALALCLRCSLASAAVDDPHPVLFDTSDPGVEKAIRRWGFDVTWPSSDNATRSLEFMGPGEVDFVRVGFRADAPLVDGKLSAATIAELNAMSAVAALAGPDTPWTLMPSTESGVDPWFNNGSQVVPSRWVQGLEATAAHYDHRFILVEPFNEPDYPWGQGTKQNLADICALLAASPVFADIPLGGPSTLNSDQAASWYAAIKDRVQMASTHTLAGTMQTYIDFLVTVGADGASPINPEAHNVVEVIAGAEYGLEEAMWWGAAERTRGAFVVASQGQRLGYAEDRAKWTAAAVYRAPSGTVQAFVGASERQAVTTNYQFVAKDRAVFFDGYGPSRVFDIAIPGGNGYQVNQPNAEKLLNITWGEDIQPVIDGRYAVVNRASGKVLEVAGGSQSDGANIQQNAHSGDAHQHWDILPLNARDGGDYSYFSFKAAHSGKSLDVYDWSLAGGGDVRQWLDYGNQNQEWFFEYVEDGYFRIRSRWSGKLLGVSGASVADGANVQQQTAAAVASQQWRLVPVGAAVEFEPPAAPSGLKASAGAVSVALEWDASAASDLDGYSVFRSAMANGPFELIARGLTVAAFTDNEANQAKPYHYRVAAFDKSLNRSAFSDTVSATPTGAPALTAHWPFDADSNDRTANANNAAASPSAEYGSGKVGAGSLALNGADTFVLLPATIANFDALTVAAWVYWNGGDDGQRIFDFGNAGEASLSLAPRASGGGMRFEIRNGAAKAVLDAPALATGAWIHVAVALGADGIRLCVNGQEVAASAEASIKPSAFRPVLNYIGKSQSASDPRFSGRIDDVRIYNVSLRADEVASLAGAVPPPAPARLQGAWTGSSIDLSWAEAVGADSYSVRRATTADGPFTTVATGLLEPAFSDTDAVHGEAYVYAIAAENAAGESALSEIAVSTLSPAEAWRLARFGAIENAGEAADGEDPDGDGLPNLLERAFGGDPNVAEPDVMPQIDEMSPLLSITYRRALAATDLAFSVLESMDLDTPWELAEGDSETLNDDGTLQTVRFTRPSGAAPALFLRVAVAPQ